MNFLPLGYSLIIFVFGCPALACPKTEENKLKNNIDSVPDHFTLEKELNTPPPALPPVPAHLYNNQLTKPKNNPSDNQVKVLVLGGGYSPSGNQLSLESNVKYFRKVQNAIGLGNASTQVYFADGKEKGRDLQIFDPKFEVPQVNLIFAELFGKTKGIANQYRSNQLNPDGPSSIISLNNWFNSQKTITGNQQNIIYFTGHGGKGSNKNPNNTTMYLWDNQKLNVSDFVKKLDQLPEQQSSILVMVQCYSGGFANVIFKDGDPQKEVSNHPRAGFFSTIQTRVAAGCTPDIREENYKEYSTSFWEALSGKSRMGKITRKPDFDADGKTSLMEAHSYVCINSSTIDVPIKTSDVLLRKYLPNEFKQNTILKKSSGIIEKYLPKLLKNDKLLEIQAPQIKLASISRTDLLKLANPEEKAVFIGLSEQLKLKGQIPDEELANLKEKFKKEREEIQKKKKNALDQKNKYRDSLRKKLLLQYPEVSNPFHSTTAKLISSTQNNYVLEIVNREETWKKLMKQKKIVDSFESQRFAIEKKEVKIMRLKKCMENIILAHKLIQQGTDVQINRYKKMLKLERTVLKQS